MELLHLCCEPGESLGLFPQDVKLAEAQVSKPYENQWGLMLKTVLDELLILPSPKDS